MKTILYDLIYNPDERLGLLKRGAEHGATTKNGLEMLLQAFASWEFWKRQRTKNNQEIIIKTNHGDG